MIDGLYDEMRIPKGGTPLPPPPSSEPKGEREKNDGKCSATVANRLRRLPTIACSDNRYHGRH